MIIGNLIRIAEGTIFRQDEAIICRGKIVIWKITNRISRARYDNLRKITCGSQIIVTYIVITARRTLPMQRVCIAASREAHFVAASHKRVQAHMPRRARAKRLRLRAYTEVQIYRPNIACR